MKLKIPSYLSNVNRRAKQLSIGGLFGLTLLTSTALGQGFTPGSVFQKSGDPPFSMLEEVEDQSSIVVPPLDEPVEQQVWSPPATPASTTPAWSPPATQVPALPAVQQPATPNPIQHSIMQPPATQTDEQVGVLVEQEPQLNISLAPLETAPIVSAQEFDTSHYSSWQSLGGEQQVYREEVVEQIQKPNQSFDSFSPGVPAIPASQEVLSLETAGEFVDAAVPSLGSVDGLGESVVSPGVLGQALENTTQRIQNIGTGPVATPRAVAGVPFKTPVRNILGGLNTRLGGGDGSVHATGQLNFVSFSRDYRGNGRQLSNGIPNLFANGPDEGDFFGVDFNYGRRRSDGKGWEFRFIGFDPDAASDVAGSDPELVWGGLAPPLNDPSTFPGGIIPGNIPATFGLSGVGFDGFFSVADVFNDAGNHRVTRDSEFGSVELNFLRATSGQTRLSCGNATVELFGGLRAVSFEETITFAAGATSSDFFPSSALYSSEVENHLFGIQVGGRLERQLSRGWGYTFGTRVGIYNNRVESRQRAEVGFADGSTLVPSVLFGANAGEAFDFSGKDNELAFLGELDLGVVYQFRPRLRARFGFRGIAVTNVADAAGQFEDSLFDVEAVAEPRAFSDFIVGGFYYGVDYAF